MTGLRNPDRANQMAIMYQQGLLLEQIGEHFGVTRERVRQIVKKLGLTAEHGGQRKRAEHKLAAIANKRDLRCMTKWGVNYPTMKARRADGTLAAFIAQRNAARLRGIAWALAFPQWLEVWERSGKLAQRGRGKDHYVMSRIKDEGGYVFGNVHIQLSTDNNSQGLKKCRAHKAKFTGVYCIYPGSSKPWLACISRKPIGAFATQEEAAAARASYLQANPEAALAGRGYAFIRSANGTVRYQVMVSRTYVGTFGTTEEALAARQAFIDTKAALTQPIDCSVEAGNPRGDSRLVHASESLAHV